MIKIIEELKQLEERIEKIELRNRRVEVEKDWETSKIRIFSICTITYIIAIVYMSVMNTKNIFVSALVPVIGFYLSTLSLPIINKIWLRFIKNKR